MKRWTNKDENGNYAKYLFEENTLEIRSLYPSEVGYIARGGIIDRLAAYENTGLTPEEIKKLQEANILLQKQANLAHKTILAIKKEINKPLRRNKSNDQHNA